LRHGCGRLRHDQRYVIRIVIVTASATEPVIPTELQRQPGLAGRHAEHLAVTPAVAVRGQLAIAGFRVAFGRRERLGWPTLATEVAAAGAGNPVG
jgi:hypothetical protein